MTTSTAGPAKKPFYKSLYLQVLTAVVIGVLLGYFNPATLDTKGIAAYTGPGKMVGTVDFLMNVIPTSVVDAFAKGEILQVLLFAVLFGFALQRLGNRGAALLTFIDSLSHVLFGIVGLIMKLAPLGAFGAM